MRRLVLVAIISALIFPSFTPAQATALTCAQGGACAIGNTGPGGGIVFFIKQIGSFEESFTVSGGFGMSRTYTVALTSSQQAALPFDYLEFAPTGRGGGTWGTNGAITNNTSLLIGTGEANTDDILLTQTGVASDNAARYAKDYVNNGRTDWFLPSYHELLLMMLRVKLGTFPTSYFPDGLWASSTGGDNTTAYYSALGQLQGNVNRLATTPGVRPIRAFSAITTTPDTDLSNAAQEAAAKREAEKRSAREQIITRFKNSEKATLELFIRAEILGITPANIDELHTEIFALPKESQSEMTQVLKIARKYEVLGIIASERVKTIYSNSLIEVGLIPGESKYKATLTRVVKELSQDERSSYARIKEAIDAEIAVNQAKEDRLTKILALIASRRNG
jgi:hypothetical protein